MSKEIIARADEIINSKTGYIGGGMEGYAALALIDENGYPTVSTLTIANADGIRWLTFCTSPGQNKVKRIAKDNRAGVCINTSEYNISLVGKIEVLTDPRDKKANWFDVMDSGEHWSGPDDPNFCVLRFNTERYNLFVGYESAVGVLKEETEQKRILPQAEIMLTFDGQCEQAIELYKKAFGAKVAVFMRYSDAGPQDRPAKYDKEKDADLVFHAQMMVGNQRVLLCDNLFNDLPRGHSAYPVMTFKTAGEVKAAYDVLAEEARIVSPLNSTTYSAATASLVDKFGVFWDLMVF